MTNSEPKTPKDFLKSRRPHYFSDTTTDAKQRIDRSALEYSLSSLTSRSQETDFERFAFKLMQREVCPNLLPNTGPMGGGDSKVDAETYPVARNLALAWIVGLPGADSERWAFAFSTKAKWQDKVRSDVKKIADTKRGYSRAFFLTSQFVPAKKRAALEDELTKKHSIGVTIFDRSWILDRVFEKDHQQLAIDELRLDVQVISEQKVGPNDAERIAELGALEKRLEAALADTPVAKSVVEDGLRAAILVRGLERPRVEIDGHFERATRLARQHGSRHQQLIAEYQKAWTSYFWFSDMSAFSSAYDAVETLAGGTTNIYEVELLGNLYNVQKAAVTAALPGAEEKFRQRTNVLTAILERFAADSDRQSAALQARTFL